MGGSREHAIGQTDGESSISPRVELHFIFEYSDSLSLSSTVAAMMSTPDGHCRLATSGVFVLAHSQCDLLE